MLEEAIVKEQVEDNINSKLSLATKHHREFILKSSGEDLVNAINYYIEAIKENPNEASAYYRLAVLMYENKQIGVAGAIEQCETAVKLAPDNPDARMYLGYFLSLKGDKKEARVEFKKAIKLSPKNTSRARLVMALDLLEKKNIANILKAAFFMTQGTISGIFDKAALNMLLDNIKEDVNYVKYNAIGSVLELMKLDKNAYQLYSDALDNSKNPSVFYEKMARIAVKKNRFDVALQCHENAAKLSHYAPNNLIDTIEFIQNNYPEKTDELIDYYNILLEKMPEFSRSYYELGHLYVRKNDFINASSAFKLAVQNDKENPFYLNSLAYSYVQLEQYPLAIEFYKKAIEKNPDNEWTAVVAQALAAIYYKINNDYEAAITVLEYALTLTKNKGQIYILFGDIYFDSGSSDIASKYYNMALMEGIRDAKIYSRLAVTYFENNFVQEAIDSYKLAIETDKLYDIAYNNLGVIYLDCLHDTTHALSYFIDAIDINPDYMLAHFNLGRCYAVLNRQIDAAREFQTAINLNKNTNEMDESDIQEKLHKLFET